MEQKLDKIDKKILAELDKNCRISDSELAKKVRRSRQTVAYRVRRLTEEGLITGFITSINPNKMGYQLFKIYLKLKNIPERKAVLMDHLRKLTSVYWMGESDGSWDLVFAVYAKEMYEFYEIKNQIFSLFKDIIVDLYGDVLLDVKQYPKMYFDSEISKPAEFGGFTVNNELDALDHNILGFIIDNARATTLEIAVKVSSTPTTVATRLKKMEKLGVIIQYRIGIDLIKLGYEHYKAIIVTESYSKDEEKQLLEYCSHIPQIQYFIRNLWQIEPEFVVRTYDEYYMIINKLKERFPNVIKTIDSIILRTDEWTPGYKKLFVQS
jgi:DNA-binding Lrp family transcriptional regulator